jgi:protein gp37
MAKTDIDWADWVTNLQTGCTGPLKCGNKYVRCDYCFADRFAKRLRGRYGYPYDNPFKPSFHNDKMRDFENIPYVFKSKNPDMPKGRAIIFYNDMGETFDPNAEPAWPHRTMQSVALAGATPNQHQCVILTKRPDRAFMFFNTEYPVETIQDNLWLGVSVESLEYWRRARDMLRVNEFYDIATEPHLVLSLEPLHGTIALDSTLKHFGWIIVGAETGNRKERVRPVPCWIDDIVKEARRYDVPLFLKDNLKPYYDGDLIKEWPKAMSAEVK